MNDPFIIPSLGYFLFFIFAIPEHSFSRGFSEYLHNFDPNLRQKVCDDIIFIKNTRPIISTFGILRFLRIKNEKLDNNLIIIKDNIKSIFLGIIFYFILLAITVIMGEVLSKQ